MTARTIRILTMVLAVLAFLVPVSVSHARTLYVANNGVDNTVCGFSNPCRSISRAISNAVARDTIIVGPGLYGDLNKNAVLGEAGEETGFPGCFCLIWMDRAVTLISSHGAAATIIAAQHLALDKTVSMVGGGELGRPGQGFTITQTGCGIYSCAALKIESVTAKVRGNQIVTSHYNARINGIRVYGLAGEVLIEGNEIRGWGNHGVWLTGSGTTVRKNSIRLNDRGLRSEEGSNTIEGNVITANERGIEMFDDVTFVGNAVFGNRFEGIQVYGSFTGTIERNNIVSTAACGVANNPGVPILVAANNYWGAATGPGPDPADTVCNAPGTFTQVTPFATRPFVVAAPIDP